MASVRKVAAEAGVSPATVSRILNNDAEVDSETRRRVLEVANQLGYAPRIGRRINTILGIALPSDPPSDLGSFDGALVSGARRACRDEGFHLALLDLKREKKPREAYTQFFARCGIRAIVLRRLPDLDEILQELTQERFPHVLIADRSDLPGVSWIDTDSKTASEEAVSHLLSMGHRRIAVTRYSRGGVDIEDRLDGYRLAHQKAGVEVDESLIIDAGDGLEDGERVIDSTLWKPNPPTAFYMTHSMSSVGGLKRLLERGVEVPSGVSYIGFDDCDSREYIHPRMTVVRQNSHEMAYRATQWLIRSLGGETEPLNESLPGVFEVNKTTSLAPQIPVRMLPDGRVVVEREP